MSSLKKTIFIVDDERIITGPLRRLFRAVLQDLGEYDLQTANDPLQALQQIKDGYKEGEGYELALVVADIMMPQMNGLDFLAEVRSIFPLAPRIVLTGYADKENAIRALNELDLFQYVEKPWDNVMFRQLVFRALQKHRQDKLETLFRRYVPFEVIEQIIEQDERALLVGTDMEATVLFLDIADFTTISEQMPARDVVKILNLYLTAMVEIIHEHKGILDKYTGDGLMALFGVPRSTGSVGEDARNAVLAAAEIVQKVALLNEEMAQLEGQQPLIRIRIGINTGKVVVGNIGSQVRVNYTAVGDVVNTAARIENEARHAMNDSYACILIGENTYQQANDLLESTFGFESQDLVPLKGKKQPIALYKVNSLT